MIQIKLRYPKSILQSRSSLLPLYCRFLLESLPKQSLDSSPGTFLSIRDEIRRQLEYGHKKGATIANEKGEVKLGVDAAKLTHYESGNSGQTEDLSRPLKNMYFPEYRHV